MSIIDKNWLYIALTNPLTYGWLLEDSHSLFQFADSTKTDTTSEMKTDTETDADTQEWRNQVFGQWMDLIKKPTDAQPTPSQLSANVSDDNQQEPTMEQVNKLNEFEIIIQRIRLDDTKFINHLQTKLGYNPSQVDILNALSNPSNHNEFTERYKEYIYLANRFALFDELYDLYNNPSKNVIFEVD